MEKQNISKIMKIVASYILILAMLFSILSPIVAQSLETDGQENIEQEKEHDILSDDSDDDEVPPNVEDILNQVAAMLEEIDIPDFDFNLSFNTDLTYTTKEDAEDGYVDILGSSLITPYASYGNTIIKIGSKTLQNAEYRENWEYDPETETFKDSIIDEFGEIFKALGGKRKENKRDKVIIYTLNKVNMLYESGRDPLHTETSVMKVLELFDLKDHYDKLTVKEKNDKNNRLTTTITIPKPKAAKVKLAKDAKDFLWGLGGAISDNMENKFWTSAMKMITGCNIEKFPKPAQLTESYYLGRVVGDAISIVIGLNESIAGVATIIASVSAGGGAIFMSGGGAVIAGIEISKAGVLVGNVAVLEGSAVAVRAFAALGDDISTFMFYKDGGKQGNFNHRDKYLNQAKNARLKRIINELYRSEATFGDGGTADMLKHEFDNNLPLKHLQKAQERIKNLNDIILEEKLSKKDLSLAYQLLNDLYEAVKYVIN